LVADIVQQPAAHPGGFRNRSFLWRKTSEKPIRCTNARDL